MQISTNQFGFMPGRSTAEAIFLIRQVMERFKEQKDIHMVFIDLEKAYDKISRNVMWWALDKHKVPSKYATLIKDMYNNVVISVRTNDGNTDYFTFLSTEHYSSFTGSHDVLSTFYPLFSCVTLCLDKQNNPFSINCSSSFGCLSRICFTKTAILFIFEKDERGKAMGPDGITIKVWRCLRDIAIVWLTKIFNNIFRSNKMPESNDTSLELLANAGEVHLSLSFSEVHV